ncbi:MAG: carbohydrate ABC transporter substrate-binding protein [Clostridiales bacterium]|nr:carbohydrate ABC transporter substrate-binding protein [Clostridiales bacterium]
MLRKDNNNVRGIALLMSIIMASGVLASCSTKRVDKDIKVRSGSNEDRSVATVVAPEPVETEATPTPTPSPTPSPTPEVNTINVFYSSDIMRDICETYKVYHPDCSYDFTYTQIYNESSSYEQAVDQALVSGDSSAPDIFTVDCSYLYKYTNGDMSGYAVPYSNLGIDVDTMIEDAEIAPYTVDLGTRQFDDEVVALSYTSGACFMIYRTDIAEEVLGTSDPSEVASLMGAGTGKFDKLMNVADKMQKAGYFMTSSSQEFLRMILDSSDEEWIVDGEFNIKSSVDDYLDYLKEAYDNGYFSDQLITQWSEAWYADIKGKGDKEVFCFYGPSWLVNYIMNREAGDLTYGMWNICEAPVTSVWGGTYIVPSIYATTGDYEKQEVIADLITWITLDDSETGFQYLYANGYIGDGLAEAVPSNTVMSKSSFPVEFLGGQDPFEVYITANEKVANSLYQEAFIYNVGFIGDKYLTGDDYDDLMEDLQSYGEVALESFEG